jgi:hypothetical protein
MAVPIIIVRNAYMKLRNLIIHKAVTKKKKYSRIVVEVFMFGQTVRIITIYLSIILHHCGN